MKQVTASIIGVLVILASQGLTIAKNHVQEDNQLDLAAAYALEGMLPEVRSILDTEPAEWHRIPPASAGRRSPEQAKLECRALQWALLDHFLKASPEDPFDLLVRVLEENSWGGSDHEAISSLVWRRLFARYAEREGYRPVSDYMLRSAKQYLQYRIESNRFENDLERQAATAQLSEVDHEIGSLLESAGERSQHAPVENSGEEDDLHPLLTRLLQTPRLAPFHEVPLSPKFQPLELSEDEEEAKVTKALAGFSFPEGFAPIRAERHGEEAVAIGVSQDYDPIGEISRGAYWVIRSHDAGKTWDPPLYTGLRIQQPYVVRPVSNAPLLAGDHLQVEVIIEELDEESITFPPVGLRAKREQKGLMLEIPFFDLERDSDGDGLTDLAEERLVLDPLNTDTDGDGVGDGWDQLPQVPWNSAADENAKALAAVLGRLSGGKLPGIIHEIAGPKASLDDLLRRAKRPTLGGEQTMFIVAQRNPFRALLPSLRTVVPTKEEFDLAQKKFGPMFPSEIPLFILNREQRRGYVIWDESWRGGILKLEYMQDGTWRAQTVSEWIT
jgi:hypothetical protein